MLSLSQRFQQHTEKSCSTAARNNALHLRHTDAERCKHDIYFMLELNRILYLLTVKRRKTSYFTWVNILTLHVYYEYKRLKNGFIRIMKLSEILTPTFDNSVNVVRRYSYYMTKPNTSVL